MADLSQFLWRPVREVDPLYRREMRERWRRVFTYFLLFGYSLILSLLAHTLYGRLIPQEDIKNLDPTLGLGRPYFLQLSSLQILLSLPLGIMLATPSIAVERERGSLVDYVLSGLTAREIVRAKFWSLGTFVFVLAFVPFPVLALCFPLGGISPAEYCSVFALAVATAVSSATFGINISVTEKRVNSALWYGLYISVAFTFLSGPFLYALPFLRWQTVLLVSVAILVFVPRRTLRTAVLNLEFITGNLEASQETNLSERRLASGMFAEDSDKYERIEAKPTAFDEKLKEIAACNPIALRELRTYLRQLSRWRKESADTPSLQTEFWGWCIIGCLLAFGCWWLRDPMPWRVLWGLIILGSITRAGILGATAITREREQGMLFQVQLTALSPRDIVVGKLFSILLVTARLCFWPLWAIWLGSWSEGLFIPCGVAFLTLASLTLAASLGLVCSLLWRNVTIATSSTIGLLFLLLVLLPLMAYQGATLGLWFPKALQLLWVDPILRFIGVSQSPLPIAAGLFLLAMCCTCISLGLGQFCAWRLKYPKMSGVAG